MLPDSGSIFYKDNYDTFYNVEWEQVGDVIDITTTIQQPYVWGQADSGRLENNILYRDGIISIIRQVLRPLIGGYEIVAEGSSQFEGQIQMNFPCEEGPQDPFKFHLDCSVLDQLEFAITDGPRWADPDDSNDSDAIWGDVTAGGAPIIVGGADTLEWLDVWT